MGNDGEMEGCSVQLTIHLVRDSLQPLVGSILAGHLQGQMGEPAVRRGAVPVLHARGDVDHVAGM